MQNASLAFGLFKTKLDDKAYPSLVARFYEITMPNAAWDHFNGGKDDTVCHHCGKVVKNKGGNTSNLMAHIKTKQFYGVKKYRYYRYFFIYRYWFSISQQPKTKSACSAAFSPTDLGLMRFRRHMHS